MSRTRRWPTALVAGLLASTLATSAAAARFPYDSGETVQLNGIVTDTAGEPLAGLEVVLEVSKMGFSVRPWGNSKREIVRGSTKTDKRGAFGLEWNWANGYNHFELMVVVPSAPGGEALHVLEQIDVSDRVAQGSPVAVPVMVRDTTILDFMESLVSDEQRRIFAEMGQPDRVDLVDYQSRKEASWWYFEAGKVYLWVDGALKRVGEFDPVRPF